jgi:hypothetical protein
MRLDKRRIIFSGVRGRNGADSPIALAEDEVVEAVNVDFYDGALCRKRRGTLTVSNTSGPAAPYGAVVHLPSASTEALAEIFAISQLNGALCRFSPTAGVYSWSTPTIADAAVVSSVFSGATLNGKCFMCYDSAVNRLHCWDGTSIRRVGLALPSAATVANTGAGAYAATLRYYRVAWAHISGSTHVRRSELSASVSFTPSGAGTHARVTRPTAAGEGETHWLVYASADDVYSNFHLIATVAIGTTTYDDNATPSAYTGDAPQIAGLNVPPPSAKHVITDGNRLLMAGAYETSAGTGGTEPKYGRVWFTRVLGSSGIGDDESIPNTSAVGTIPAQKNWIDVGENDGGGAITSLAIINGVIFVFKARHIYRLAPTGDDLQPYRAVLVSNIVGCTLHKTLTAGEDASGQPALYFASGRGWYRLSLSGDVTYISRQIEDRYDPSAAFLTSSTVYGLYHSQRNQVWCSLGTLDDADFAVYDVRKDGWTIYEFNSGFTYCGVMFPELVNNAGSLQQDGGGFLKPIVLTSADHFMGDCDTTTTDIDGNFQAYITSRPFFPTGLGFRAELHDATLVAEASSGVTITGTFTGDFGTTGSAKTATALLTAGGSETRVIKRMDDSALGGCSAVQITLGDGSAASNAWVLDGLSIPITPQESLA